MPYAYSWYLDATTSKKWDALIKGDYEAVMPLPYNRKLFGFKQIYQPFFSQQLGVFSFHQISPSELNTFIKAIPSSYLRIYTQLNTHNQIKELKGVELTERPTYILDLSFAYEAIRASYSKNLKRNLKKAEQNQLAVKELNVADFLTFYAANPVETGKAYNIQLLQLLNRLLYELERRKMGKPMGVFTAAGLLCGAFFLVQNQQRAIYLLARSNDEGRRDKAMPYLIDFVLEDLAGRVEVFDFEGSSIPSLARFFKSFGAREEKYEAIKKSFYF